MPSIVMLMRDWSMPRRRRVAVAPVSSRFGVRRDRWRPLQQQGDLLAERALLISGRASRPLRNRSASRRCAAANRGDRRLRSSLRADAESRCGSVRGVSRPGPGSEAWAAGCCRRARKDGNDEQGRDWHVRGADMPRAGVRACGRWGEASCWTPYAGANRIRFNGTLSACALVAQAPRSVTEFTSTDRRWISRAHRPALRGARQRHRERAAGAQPHS